MTNRPADSRTAGSDPVAAALVELAGRVPGGTVVDVGGGSGTRAVPLARIGCHVLVVDSSIDALAILRRRAADAGVADLVEAVQGDAIALSGAVRSGSADLVLCHHLLETVEDPAATMAGIAAVLRPGGTASILVASRFAAVLVQAMAGRFVDASAMLADPDGRSGPSDPLRRRFDVDGLESLLRTAGLVVESINGVGVVSGLTPGGRRAPSAADGGKLSDLEAELASHPHLRELGTDLHAVVIRPSGVPEAEQSSRPESDGPG